MLNIVNSTIFNMVFYDGISVLSFDITEIRYKVSYINVLKVLGKIFTSNKRLFRYNRVRYNGSCQYIILPKDRKY